MAFSSGRWGNESTKGAETPMQKPKILKQDEFDVALRVTPRDARNAYFQLVTYVEALEALLPQVTVTDSAGKSTVVPVQIGTFEDDGAPHGDVPSVAIDLAPETVTTQEETPDATPKRSSSKRGK